MGAETLCCGSMVALIGFLALFYVVSIFNGLITLRNNIDKSWANIDVLLKQRSDLIPNLVETVKGYMKHEKSVLEEVTRLRAGITNAVGPAQKARKSAAMTSALKSIFATVENYPQLKANENFLKLQDQITSLENQIADRREFYNDSVLLYNTRIKSIPDTFVAMVLGMRDREYFKATDEDSKPVEVNLK